MKAVQRIATIEARTNFTFQNWMFEWVERNPKRQDNSLADHHPMAPTCGQESFNFPYSGQSNYLGTATKEEFANSRGSSTSKHGTKRQEKRLLAARARGPEAKKCDIVAGKRICIRLKKSEEEEELVKHPRCATKSWWSVLELTDRLGECRSTSDPTLDADSAHVEWIATSPTSIHPDLLTTVTVVA